MFRQHFKRGPKIISQLSHPVCHTFATLGHCREPRTARECRTDAGFVISWLCMVGGSIPPPKAILLLEIIPQLMTDPVAHTGARREPVRARECRADAGFRISAFCMVGGSIPPPTANTSRALREGPAPVGAPASDSAGCGLHRSPGPSLPAPSRRARLLPRLLRETPRAANEA